MLLAISLLARLARGSSNRIIAFRSLKHGSARVENRPPMMRPSPCTCTSMLHVVARAHRPLMKLSRGFNNHTGAVVQSFTDEEIGTLLRQMQWHARWCDKTEYVDLPGECVAFHTARMRECEHRIRDCGYELTPKYVADLHRNAAWGARLKRVLSQ